MATRLNLTVTEQIGIRLSAARREVGKSQADVCKALEVSTNKWSQWESGKYMPDIQVISKFCDVYGISLDWIYRERADAMTPDRAERLWVIYKGLLAERMRAA